MLLDATLPAPEILPPDSVRKATQAAVEMLKSDPNAFWQQVLDSATHFGLKVLMALVLYFVGAWVIRRVRKAMERVFERKQTERTLASFVSSLVSISLTVLLIVLVISILGVDTTSFAALLAAGGMAIGMALSGTVQNFAGGIMLLVFRPFKAGDFIEACGYKGTVMETTIVSTKILTTDNRVIILPNGSLSNGTIDNYSTQPLRRVDWEVSVGYGTDAEACKQAILEMLDTDERILHATDERPVVESKSGVNTQGLPIPDPFVALLRLNANDITFVVRAWVRAENYWDVYFHFSQLFYTELPKRGFTFAYPHCDVTILSNNK